MGNPAEVYQLEIDTGEVERGLTRVNTAVDHLGDRMASASAKARAAMEQQIRSAGGIPPSIDKVSASYDRLRGRLDPVLATQMRFEREMVSSLATINNAVRLGVTTELEAAATIARLKAQQVAGIEAVRQAQVRLNATPHIGANDNAGYRRQNLTYQLFDVGQMTALGQNPAYTLMQQGPQIAQLYAMQGGLNALWKDATGILVTLVRVAGPWIAAAGAMYGAYKLITSYGTEASLAIDSTTAALAAQAAPFESLSGRVSELQRITDEYAKAIRGTAKDQSIATASIIANSEREFNAKKALLELELKRQRAAIEAQRAEVAIAGYGMRREVGTGVNTRMDLERQGFADPRAGSVPFVRLPDDITGIRKTQDTLDNSASADKVKELQANLTLAEIAVRGVEDALKVTFSESVATSIGRVAKETKGSADAWRDLVKAADDRIAQLRTEIDMLGMTGAAAAALRYEQELLSKATDKGRTIDAEQIAVLREKARVVGELTEKLAEQKIAQDLLFERDQLFRSPIDQRIASTMRGAGMEVNFDSQIAGMIRFNEQLKIGRDLAQQFASSFISDLRNGETALDAATNAAIRLADQLLQMALNQAINALFSNLMNTLFFRPTAGGFASMLGLAKGGAFDGGGNLVPFARGGVVDRPTVFPFARGIGLMGEAGPEAIIPLGRDNQGRLGVRTAANQNGGGTSNMNVNISVNIDGANGDQHVIDLVQQGVSAGLSQFDQALPDRMKQIKAHPRMR